MNSSWKCANVNCFVCLLGLFLRSLLRCFPVLSAVKNNLQNDQTFEWASFSRTPFNQPYFQKNYLQNNIFFPFLFTSLIKKYLLITYYVPGTGLHAEDTKVNQNKVITIRPFTLCSLLSSQNSQVLLQKMKLMFRKQFNCHNSANNDTFQVHPTT